jgi:hypothetical protein
LEVVGWVDVADVPAPAMVLLLSHLVVAMLPLDHVDAAMHADVVLAAEPFVEKSGFLKSSAAKNLSALPGSSAKNGPTLTV